MLDPEWARIGSDWLRWILGIIGGAGLMLWATLGRRDTAAARTAQEATRRIGELEVQLAKRGHGVDCIEHGQRLTRVEERLQLSPTHDDLARLHGRIDHLGPQVSEIRGTLESVRRSQERIEQYLLEHGPRSGD